MNAALGNLLARVAQGDLSVHEARAIACSHWLGGNRDVAESLSAFAVELTKLRDEMQTDRYALSVASRSVEEIEKILKSPHLDAATRAKIKMFSFGKRHSNVGALVYRCTGSSGGPAWKIGDHVVKIDATESAAMKRGREIHERMAAHFRRQWPAIPDQLFTRLDFDRVDFRPLAKALKAMGPKAASRSGKSPKARPSKRRSRASRPARGADPKSR